MQLTLLIADDDSLMLTLLARPLKEHFNIITCSSGTEAIAACDAHPGEIALALLDFDMPGATGVEVAYAIRAKHQIPFMIVSRFHDAESVAQATQAGALGYLVKPIAPDDVLPAVRTALARATDLTAGWNQSAALAVTLNESRIILQQVVSADEVARKDLVSELHDQLGQSLTTLRMEAKLIANSSDLEFAKSRARNIDDTATQLYGAVRNIMLHLRPEILTMLSLGAAIAYLARAWASSHPDIDVSTSGIDATLTQDPPLDVVLFRATQEILTNISKHAHARHVVVSLVRVESELRLRVDDDGVGIDSAMVPGIGIIGMREKIASLGGILLISSTPGGGTTVEIVVRAA